MVAEIASRALLVKKFLDALSLAFHTCAYSREYTMSQGLEQQTGRAARVKFASQLPQELLASLKGIARDEGRQLQSVFEEAVRLYLQQREQSRPRAHVLDALERSMVEHDALYRKLAQ